MARIRSVKPELRTSYLVASWPRDVRYFWVLFFGYLDDEGRGLDIPKTIAGDCFPHDDDIDGKQIDVWLDLMTHGEGDEPGPVCRYAVAGKRYVHAVNWHEHQKINRPTASRIPACPHNHGPVTSDNTTAPTVSEPLSERVSESLNENSVNGAEEVGAGEKGAAAAAARESRSEYPDRLRQTVIAATGATDDEAEQLIARVQREKNPRSLAPFVKRMAEDGDLKRWLADIRSASGNAGHQATLKAIRDGPPCPHRQPGGALPHPVTGEPTCPLCRAQARRAS